MASDYPHSESLRYPPEARSGLRRAIPADDIDGLFRTREGDIRTWLIHAQVISASRDVVTALAYLDLMDTRSKSHSESLADIRGDVVDVKEAIRGLALALQDQSASLDRLTNFLAAVVPNWRTLNEVNNGDDMGMGTPSAAAVGVVVHLDHVRQEAGFAHEDVVAIDPPAGTLVPRGSTIRVTLNLEG